MYDIEFLSKENSQIRGSVAYEMTTSLFKNQIIQVFSKAWASKGNPITPINTDDPISHLNEGSLFGSNSYLIDLSETTDKDALRWRRILGMLAERRIEKSTFILVTPEQEAILQSEEWTEYKRQSNHLEGVGEINRHQVGRVLKFFYLKESQHPTNPSDLPSNLDLMETSLIRYAQSEEFTFEAFYRRLDVINTMCVEGSEFDSAEFSRLFERETLDSSSYVWHECLFRIAISKRKSQAESAIGKLIQEVDIQRNIYSKESRAILSYITNALKDLLLINSDIGGTTDTSPLSNYKRSKLASYAGVDCFRLLGVLNLILTDEPRYKNSPNIIVELQTRFTPKILEGLEV